SISGPRAGGCQTDRDHAADDASGFENSNRSDGCGGRHGRESLHDHRDRYAVIWESHRPAGPSEPALCKMFRFANGKIVESWAARDDLGVLVQLGHLPPMGPPKDVAKRFECRARVYARASFESS